MLENTNINWNLMTDEAIVNSIGEFVKVQRLRKNKTQSRVAKDAGINRWTVGQLESGEGVTLASLIQILRALDLLYVFDSFSITEQVSPLEMAKLEKEKRKRARGNNKDSKDPSTW